MAQTTTRNHGIKREPRTYRIALVCGARPNFVKAAPLYRIFSQEPETFHASIIHTGQHYDARMSAVFFEELGLPQPDISLNVGSGPHAEQTAGVLAGLQRACDPESIDVMISVGDVNSTLAASLYASKHEILGVHVEAGLRSGDRAMPEEINRLVADHVSDVLYASCRDAERNLYREGIDPRRVTFVGNIMIDTLVAQMPRVEKSTVLSRLGLEPQRYVLITMHRPGNVDGREGNGIHRLMELLNRISAHDRVVFPIHPRTEQRMVEAVGELTWASLVEGRSVTLIPPQGYIDFLALERSARVVLTDSGGVQEETTVLGVPCLTLRPNTERPVTISEGTNALVGFDVERVMARLYGPQGAPNRKPYVRPRLWDGNTAERLMVDLVARLESNDPSIGRLTRHLPKRASAGVTPRRLRLVRHHARPVHAENTVSNNGWSRTTLSGRPVNDAPQHDRLKSANASEKQSV